MTETDARAFVAAYAATGTNPALSDDEVTLCLSRARLVDAAGRGPTDPAWVPTYWGTRAVVVALELKLAKVAAKVDLTADGTTINASQITANLTALRRSWRAKMLPGSV